MGENEEQHENVRKTKKRSRKWLKRREQESDKRTAAFVANRLEEVQETLSDLMADMRTFEHYFDMEWAVFCLRMLQRIKRKYRSFADNGVWPDGDD